jgi:hypothetical protein
MGSIAAITGLVSTGVGAVNTGVGAYNQSQASLDQGRFARSMGNVNANMTEMQAQDAFRRGNIAANRQNLRTSLLMGQQRATAAAQGVDVNSGSALDLQANAARMGVIDANTIRMNAYKEAMGLRMEESNQRFRGNMAYAAGRSTAFNTMLAGGMNATRQIAGGLDTYYKNRPPLKISPYNAGAGFGASAGADYGSTYG